MLNQIYLPIRIQPKWAMAAPSFPTFIASSSQSRPQKSPRIYTQGPVVKAQYPNPPPPSSLTKKKKKQAKNPRAASCRWGRQKVSPLRTSAASSPISLNRLDLRLMVRSSLTEPGLELGSILLSSVKIQPSWGFRRLWKRG